MKYNQKGDNINYKNTGDATINYGDVVVIGKRIGVANCNIKVGSVGTVSLTGVYSGKANATAFSVGDALYWDTENSELTKDNTGGIVAGICVEDKPVSVTNANVRL